ncbi:hypothetical protein E5676_scaffold264G00730 [Cucumis melo var. makuwa]|uniref:Uncharacterized protein n=1 Tax=Cucumis melo var. makuwa TaxID=1194695 RepID=A0A5D3BSJ1_CUCMM|nr:hypothetical protein E5676_scaffold264G00730 [Cucumis melo var. makuwa]
MEFSATTPTKDVNLSKLNVHVPTRPPATTTSYDAIDPRGRIEDDRLFYGPVRLGQLTGYNGGEPDDNERRFNERHEPLYSFKHGFRDSDGERYRNKGEDCSRPFRFCAEDDPRISWKRREAHNNSNEEDNEAHAGNPYENFQRQTNQAAVIRVQGSMTKARAKRLQDG